MAEPVGTGQLAANRLRNKPHGVAKRDVTEPDQDKGINMKRVNAQLFMKVDATCPECHGSQDILTSCDATYVPVIEAIFSDCMDDLGIIVTCQECSKEFELNDIDR